MTGTLNQANIDILTLFKTAWDTTGFIALYENVAGEPPATPSPWARITLRHSGGGQGSLSGALGTKRWDRNGVLIVQVFVPNGEGLSQAYSLAKIVLDAYEGVSSPLRGVWFRNARINEVGPDGEWFQVNALIDFTYDEIK